MFLSFSLMRHFTHFYSSLKVYILILMHAFSELLSFGHKIKNPGLTNYIHWPGKRIQQAEKMM